MDQQTTASTVLGDNIVEWLADEALHETEPAALYGELCQRLRGIGMPILRGQAGFRVLHPLYDASSLNWNPGTKDIRPLPLMLSESSRFASLTSSVVAYAVPYLGEVQL